MPRFLRVSYVHQRIVFRCLAPLVVAMSVWAVDSAARGESIEWTRQLGTSSTDRSNGVSADGLGNVYISGCTDGSLGGPNAGGDDAFVSKYDAAGTLQWTRQLGTSSTDLSHGVSADGLGNVYISGYTDGSLGGPNAGSYDAFVSKYDAAGTLQWTRQLGTSATDHEPRRVGRRPGECLHLGLHRRQPGRAKRRQRRRVCQQVRCGGHPPVDAAVGN